MLADNKDIVILGGLIQEDEQIATTKVPLLGDIPVLGRLFQTEARSVDKSTLMVFIRPTIIRTPEEQRRATAIKENYIRSEQIVRTGGTEPSLDRIVRDVLGSGAAPGTP
ncbi:MAG: hypothetical protein ACFB2Z_06985 [Maricaulaceae bacterium]